jgi:predicted DNA-binding protein
MRRVLSFTLCLAACLLTSVSLADDNDSKESKQKVEKKQTEKKVQSKIQSQAKASGRIVIIEKDGTIQEIEFGFDGDDAKEGFAKLPKEVRERLEKLQKEMGNLEGIFGKGAIIGPAGKIKDLRLDLDIDEKALEGLPKEIREKLKSLHKGPIKHSSKVEAHGIIIGPDGVKREFKFGDVKGGGDVLKRLPKEIREQIERTMKEHSKKLPVEPEIAKKLSDGLRHLQIQRKIGTPGEKKGSSGIESKLDLILKRLDKMEKDIQGLKKGK